MHYKVKYIKPLDNYMLHVDFENGMSKIYNMKNIINEIDDFQSLVNINGLFKQVKVDVGGYGIYWNDYLDLSCNELYHNGIAIEEHIKK